MKARAKYLLVRIATVAAAALLTYGYIKLPTDGMGYYQGTYSASDTEEQTVMNGEVTPSPNVSDGQESDTPSEAEITEEKTDDISNDIPDEPEEYIPPTEVPEPTDEEPADVPETEDEDVPETEDEGVPTDNGEPAQDNEASEPLKEEGEEIIDVPDSTVSLNGDIEIISLTEKVTAGSTAHIKIKGSPDTKYTITVYYSSGASTAKGLEPATSNSNGYVEWSWKVGVRTKPGNYKIEITDGKTTSQISFEVS